MTTFIVADKSSSQKPDGQVRPGQNSQILLPCKFEETLLASLARNYSYTDKVAMSNSSEIWSRNTDPINSQSALTETRNTMGIN